MRAGWFCPAGSGAENPKPGSDGMTTLNASAGSRRVRPDGQWPDQGQELEERARPPVRKYQRHRCGARRRVRAPMRNTWMSPPATLTSSCGKPFSADSVSRHWYSPAQDVTNDAR